jgi:glutathione S-transferase
MPARLFVVHGSHPCAAVEKALELKGVPYRLFEWTPTVHVLGQQLVFGGRTVPGIRFEDGVKVLGSRAIMAELDRRVPEPRLYPDDHVREADRWGEQVFQPVGRRVLWPAFALDPAAMYSFQEGSVLPALPMSVIKTVGPQITRIERRINAATDEALRADLEALPGHLDKIDAWIEEGLLGGEQVNAADLQIGATLSLLLRVEDVRPLIEPRPAARLALLTPIAGRVPAGTIPATWLPASAAAPA